MLDVKYRFTFGDSDLSEIIIKCQNIARRIVVFYDKEQRISVFFSKISRVFIFASQLFLIFCEH